jgi:hypothetical protein
MKLALLWRNLGDCALYYPKLAKLMGGVTAAIFFHHLVEWQSQLSNPYNWVRVTLDEIELKTSLNPAEQELARRLLIERSLIQERPVRGQENTIEFWPNLNALEKLLETLLSDSSTISYSNIQQSKANHSNPDTSEISHKAASNFTSPNGRNGTFVEIVETRQQQGNVIKTDPVFPVQRPPISVKVNPNYKFSGPWDSPEQFEQFQRALLEHFKQKGVENPSGFVFQIVDGITKGVISPFWDEFIAGTPFGESQKVKRDWEIEPGVAYPAFEEERIQYYVQKGEPIEAAVARARADLRDTVLGKDLWDGFLRKCDRIADEAIKAQKLGLQTPYLPPSFTNKTPVTKESVMDKLATVSPEFALNSSSSAALPEAAQKVEEESSDIPSLSALQTAYKTPMGRTLVERKIAEHPEWGYGIVDGEVIDLIPF